MQPNDSIPQEPAEGKRRSRRANNPFGADQAERPAAAGQRERSERAKKRPSSGKKPRKGTLKSSRAIEFRAHEAWVTRSHSHPVLSAIEAAILAARVNADQLGGYDVAHLLSAIGDVAARSLSGLDVGHRTRDALEWARPILRPDRKKKPSPLDLMGAYARPPLARDDMVLDLRELADYARRTEHLLAGRSLTEQPRESTLEAWDRASVEELARSAYREILRGHHFFTCPVPPKDAFYLAACDRLRGVRKYGDEHGSKRRRDVGAYIRALLFAWGVEANEAKNATKPLDGASGRAR